MAGIVILFLASIAICSARFAPFITPCKIDDEACMIKQAQAAIPYFAAGIPELHVPPTDPLVLGDINGDQGDLKLHFKEINIARTKECKFVNLKVNKDTTTLSFDLECPITATGKYTAGGKLLFLEISGDGPFLIKTEKIKISLEAVMSIVDGDDKQKHWNVKSHNFSFKPIDEIIIEFSNLFDGDEAKAKPVNDIIKNSSKDLLEEIGPPIIKAIVEKAVDHIQKFLHIVPYQELLLAN